jgi:hypothetical protein
MDQKSKFDGLAWTPQTEDEWERSNRSKRWYRMFPQMEDCEAEELLGRLLQLRLDHLRSAPDAGNRALEAQFLAAELIRGIAGWALADSPHGRMLSRNEFDRLTPDQQRFLIRRQLESSLSLMQPGASQALAVAIDVADDGRAPQLFEPAKPTRRGAWAYQKSEIELRILCWAERQRGLGLKAEKARQLAAETIGRTTKALEAWKRPLQEEFGKDHVNQVLASAKRLGEAEAAGRPLPADLREHARKLHEHSIEQLAEQWKQASANRP